MLGNKYNLTARAMIAAINAYDAANPGSRIDISRVNKSDFGGDSAVERKFYRDLMKGKIQITFGNNNLLVNK